MKKSIIYLSISILFSSTVFTANAESKIKVINNPYMGAPVALATAPNGAIVNQEVLARVNDAAWTEPTIEQPAEGVWVFGGYGLAPITIIDTPEGLIAFDTGDAKHDGEIFLEAIRTVTDKPIKAIIYGHSHTGLGAGVLAEGNKDVIVIGHPGLNEVVEQNLQSGGAPSYFPELGPYLTGRLAAQFNAFTPSQGPDAWILPLVLPAELESAFIPVNTPVEHGEELMVLGQKMKFFTKWGSDDKVHTEVWLEDKKLLLTTLLWMSPPQLYSVRGDVFRDPQVWMAGLQHHRGLNAEVLISAAARPIIGKEKIKDTLEGYLDGAMFVLDQTIRGINNGQGPEELRQTMVFPQYLDAIPNNFQSYGEISSYAPAIFTHAVGWFDGDAATLKQLSKFDQAERLVALIGGRDKVMTAARDAMKIKEYVWAAQLVNHLYQINPQDREVRQLKADALRAMSYVATGANDRAHLTTQALALEGKVFLPRLILPPAEQISESPSTFVNYLRVRLDPVKSDKTDSVIGFTFDNDETASIHVRRAVAEYVKSPENYSRKADLNVSMSNESWAKLYLNQASVSDMVNSGEIKVTGDKAEFIRIYNLFDVYTPENNQTIPALKK